MSVPPEEKDKGKREADDIVDEIYEHVEPTLAGEVAREFKPWHKPRKHFLRVYQWCSEIRGLIRELDYKEGDTVRYLGLPGEDFLDIRTLAGVCDRAKVKLKYL